MGTRTGLRQGGKEEKRKRATERRWGRGDQIREQEKGIC
jgi:hypothetical protein